LPGNLIFPLVRTLCGLPHVVGRNNFLLPGSSVGTKVHSRLTAFHQYLLYTITWPCQGFWNFLVYNQGHYKRLRQRRPGHEPLGRLRALWVSASHPLGEVPQRRAEPRAVYSPLRLSLWRRTRSGLTEPPRTFSIRSLIFVRHGDDTYESGISGIGSKTACYTTSNNDAEMTKEMGSKSENRSSQIAFDHEDNHSILDQRQPQLAPEPAGPFSTDPLSDDEIPEETQRTGD